MQRRAIPRDPRSSLQGIRRLWRKNHALYQQVKAVEANPNTPITDMAPVLDALGSSPWRTKEHALAFRLIKHVCWTEEQRVVLSERLCAIIDRATQQRTSGRAILRWFLRGLSLMYPLVFFALLRVELSTAASFLRIGLVALIPAALATVMTAMITVPTSLYIDNATLRRFLPFVAALGQVGQPVAILSVVTVYSHADLRAEAASALQYITARLRPEDYGTLPARTVPALCEMLPATSPQTALVILKALFFIGDGRAFRSVETHAQRTRNQEIRETAEQLLPLLYQRALESQAMTQLLRASSIPQENGQNLLRAVRDQAGTDPAQLLRIACGSTQEEQP